MEVFAILLLGDVSAVSCSCLPHPHSRCSQQLLTWCNGDQINIKKKKERRGKKD